MSTGPLVVDVTGDVFAASTRKLAPLIRRSSNNFVIARELLATAT